MPVRPSAHTQTAKRLSDDEVAQVLAEYKPIRGAQAALARKFGVNPGYINKIVSGVRRQRPGPPETPSGERSPHCRLSDADVMEIRRLRQENNHPLKALAVMFGTSVSTVHGIVRGTRRRFTPPPKDPVVD